MTNFFTNIWSPTLPAPALAPMDDLLLLFNS